MADHETSIESDGLMNNGETKQSNESKPEDSRKVEPKLRRFLGRLKNDEVYRKKITYTAVLCWSFVGLGWLVGLNGPTFPDLMQIIGEDLASSSWMFTTGSLGYMTGSIIGGVIYDRFDKLLLLTASTFALALSSAFVPYCSSLVAMLLIKCIGGFACGTLDTGANAHMIYIWGSEHGPFLQALHFGFSFGALISPLATEPFLAKKIVHCVTGIGFVGNQSELRTAGQLDDSRRGVEVFNDSLSAQNTTTEVNFTSSNNSCFDKYEPSEVHPAFLISGAFMFSATVGLLYIYVQCRSFLKSEDDTKLKTSDDTNTNSHPMPLRLKVVFIIMLCAMLASYCIVEDCFATFLMTFSLNQLNWDKSTGAYITAVFWVSFAIGRFTGIFIVSCCKSNVLLTSYLGALLIGYSGFLASSLLMYTPLIWLFTGVLGFAKSVIFPAIFSWTSSNVVKVTGKISSVFLVSSSTAGMTFPLLIGHMMEYKSPMWFVYILIIMLIICIFSFTIIRVLVKCCLKTSKISLNENMKADTEQTEMVLMS
ncbi:sodium-dependent glucose transporter 1A-like isoform X1 [Dreissena polymorpha]|uniref:Sodium-dependent glucose transporter 1 n=1 Tax=Dreissena polymorpha TaxID=45954 RepID=A0A9D4C382_DREPO|nr:sodium-dependent glucose transporter 1A-like isoform X1 [Dreissena polymorpha]XP_052248310.1 sodium-dependent glucose transporter 1A-like isoform X1 [Dreissena polymorpha]KAH3716310.1 hypothetical protein DPMN_059031 [Dreissena polymorpha]